MIFKSVRCTTDYLHVGQRKYPSCVGREGKARLRPLEEIVALPRRSPLTPELQRALAAASSLHALRSDLEPVPVRLTATISEAGAYRYRKKDPIDLRVSRVGGRAAIGFLHELLSEHAERPFLLTLCGALMGLPFVLGYDSKRNDRDDEL